MNPSGKSQPGLAELVSTLVSLDQKVEDEVTNLMKVLSPVLAPDSPPGNPAEYDLAYDASDTSEVEKLIHDARQRRMGLVARLYDITRRARI